MRGVNNSVETVNAAAAAIISAESRVQQVTVPRRRWANFFSLYWCFGSHKQGRRISHAVLVPEQTLPRSDASAVEHPNHPPALVLPFVAPPSSPASFLQSETSSSAQSPAVPLSFSALSANSYSPNGPASIFAIGPYAHETQLVSPPGFSNFTTEPSTAPFTPPPEQVHLTTPSSPEVPFAKLLSSLGTNCKNDGNEFQSYQLYPGSPIGHLISPSSACSGTSSPFPDLEFQSSGCGSFHSFPIAEPPKILSAEGIAMRKLAPRHARNGGSLLDGQISAAAPMVDSTSRSQNGEYAVDQRVSFELTAEDVARCLGKRSASSGEATSESLQVPFGTDSFRANSIKGSGVCVDESYHDLPERARPLFFSAAKEFKFDNSDGASAEPNVGSDWWANEKVVGTEVEPQKDEHQKDWTFFPTMQQGVS
ncbi:uncharacterized protein [Typha latifolia]|uniref:uncharacterized protein isoform X1 n=1 Tax=Typha latifolia TaxID=4733 RepID=UPI003C2C2ABD